MSHTNYNGISAKPAKDETEAKVVDAENSTEAAPTLPVNIEDIDKAGVYVPETSNVPEPKQLVVGKVCKCSMLNVREKPNLNATILSTIEVGSTALVDPEESTDVWFKVIVNDQEGFCMKRYIALPQ